VQDSRKRTVLLGTCHVCACKQVDQGTDGQTKTY